MWAGVMRGKNLHAGWKGKKHEDINDHDPGRTGYNRFGTNIPGTDRPAATGEANAYAAADVSASRSAGSDSARVQRCA